MKVFFKRGSMMQEHLPCQASQRGSDRTAGQASTNFEISLKMMRDLK
jgi:hypothetical protein